MSLYMSSNRMTYMGSKADSIHGTWCALHLIVLTARV